MLLRIFFGPKSFIVNNILTLLTYININIFKAVYISWQTDYLTDRPTDIPNYRSPFPEVMRAGLLTAIFIGSDWKIDSFCFEKNCPKF